MNAAVVVDAVVRRRVEDELIGPRHAADQGGVHPELVDDVQFVVHCTAQGITHVTPVRWQPQELVRAGA